MRDRDGSPIAADGLKHIAKFYKIEDAIRGQSAEQRKAARQEQTKPLMEDFEVWLKTVRSRISAKSRLGEKLSYIAKHMGGLKLFLDAGTVEMDSNIVERAIRPIAHISIPSRSSGPSSTVTSPIIGTIHRKNISPTQS